MDDEASRDKRDVDAPRRAPTNISTWLLC